MLEELRRRASVSGTGRLMDLGCGTGQIAVPLAPFFSEVVAVDQEEETVAYGHAQASALGAHNIAWRAGSAEDVAVDGGFELITVGNAFHRMNRSVVAARFRTWLEPGGKVALLWGGTPSQGHDAWEKALADLYASWMEVATAGDRIPAGWAGAMEAEPHAAVLAGAGFEYLGKFEFRVEQAWTVETLIGFTYSTSILSREVLGDRCAAFEREVAERLRPYERDGVLAGAGSFAYELARNPA
jgi:SAM-dependent methyltransferase